MGLGRNQYWNNLGRSRFGAESIWGGVNLGQSQFWRVNIFGESILVSQYFWRVNIFGESIFGESIWRVNFGESISSFHEVIADQLLP